uniref:Ciliogenesis and planar polarity effector 2 n=1 Tax=Periophthalmus magnuspinnatus TaxID=409849 RepID=A0A3B3ZXP5_9GOBI
MAQVPSPGSIIVADWHQCKDSKEYFTKILHKKRRRQFGMANDGKTSVVARLAGVNIPNMHYETVGIETTIVYWPVKIKESGRVLFFRLQLWDCGENALKRFDHMLPVSFCKEQVDAVLLLFSFTDRISFEDLPNQITKWTAPPLDRVVKLVVGTKYPFNICHSFSGRPRTSAFRASQRICDGNSA